QARRPAQARRIDRPLHRSHRPRLLPQERRPGLVRRPLRIRPLGGPGQVLGSGRREVQDSPAIFCYDLMNEPVVPGGKRKEKDWPGPAFGDKHFVKVISLDQAGRKRPEIAKAWIKQLTTAIRKVDDKHLITVGLVDWSLDRPGLTSGFVPKEIADDL